MIALSILKTVVVILDFLFAATVVFFLSPLKWSSSEDRVSIVGFAGMLIVFLADAALIMFG